MERVVPRFRRNGTRRFKKEKKLYVKKEEKNVARLDWNGKSRCAYDEGQ